MYITIPPDYLEQECHPFGLHEWNLILLEGICLIEADKKWRRMMVYVLGHLLHEGHLGELGPVQYVPSTPASKGKVGKVSLTQEYWAYPEQIDDIVTVTPAAARSHQPARESSWWAQGTEASATAQADTANFSPGFMEPDEATGLMGGVPSLEAWERESPGEIACGTDKVINDWRTREEYLALSSDADTLPSYNDGDVPTHLQHSPPEIPSSMRNPLASPTEAAENSDSESATTVTGGRTASRWSKSGFPSMVPTLPPPVPSRASLETGSSLRRPLEMPPGLSAVSPPCKKGRETQYHKVLRVLHTLHLTYMRHQAAVEKAQAEAAPWKSRMEMAWEDVPLPDAEDDEIEAWLKKWDSMTNEEG